MRTAYCPTRCRQFTIEQYVREFGPKHDDRMRPRERPALQCYACGQDVHPVAEDFPERGHWAHDPGKAGKTRPWCPLSEPAAMRYELLSEGQEHPERGARLRSSFMTHWQKHWGMILSILSVADIHTFIPFVRKADQTKLWQRSGLDEWLVPYIFLATADFPPPAHPVAAAARSEWMRFWFESGVRHLDDLWIHYRGNFRFMSASYKIPSRGTCPTHRHLIAIEPVEVDHTWLTKSFRLPNKYQIDQMHHAFPEST